MKALKLTIFILAAISLASAGSAKYFYGEISDTQCAMNVHSLSRSHAEMIKKGTLGNDAASCARTCVRRGGEWVLRSGDVVYRLKNQSGVDAFAGQKVRVLGSLDPNGEAIDNVHIEVSSHEAGH